MDKETETQIHFQMESGKNQSDRLVHECLIGLAGLLHNQYVQVDGKQYKIEVIKQVGSVMFDIKDLPGFDHIEFNIEKTGWGRGVK